MGLTYQYLTQEQAIHLRRQRLLDLEADHCRYMMDLEELSPADPKVPAIQEALKDIEHRIALHRVALDDIQLESVTNSDGAG